MVREPSLITPIACSLAAAIAFSLARIERMPEIPKYLLILFGVLFALWAFVTGADWLVNRGVIYLRMVREGWRSPDLKLALALGSMNSEQLRVFERLSPSLDTIVYFGRGNQPNRYRLRTSMGEIDYTWISSYLTKCERVYPNLIPQHGMPGNLERDWVQWFTDEMVKKELAERAMGNQPAKWVVPMSEVWEKFGFD